MITIIDYGLGNVLAFANMYKRMNIDFTIATTADDLIGAKRLILPGVGSFDHAMQRLNNSGMRSVLDKLVLIDKVPVIGICVGMQILAKSSDEGQESGLGWINGVVKKFDVSKFSQKTHLPHMGWNDIYPVRKHGLLKGLESNALFYFLHSYYFKCEDKKDVLATAVYGDDFGCIVVAGNIYGVQCHPEKSHSNGAQLLKNFSDL
ncbi:MAG: imidazole glycerol phosphate synthase subunit HisH [Bermanella sp.]